MRLYFVAFPFAEIYDVSVLHVAAFLEKLFGSFV